MSLSTRLNQLKTELRQLDKQMLDLRQQKQELVQEITGIETQLASGKFLNDKKFLQTEYPWSREIYRVLRDVFKLEDFRSYQLSAINATLSKNDCLLIMPTGGGKSLTFQLPALISKGVTVVIAPLISLMEDHLTHLRELGIPAEVLSGAKGSQYMRKIYKELEMPTVPFRILFVTPEMLHKSKTLEKSLKKCHENQQLRRFVIDEVHCMSTWGHDFRQDYQVLQNVKIWFPNAPILGLTATATPVVINSIQRELEIVGCPVFKDSFFRSNLHYTVDNVDSLKPKEIMERMAHLINTKYSGQTGLVYCLTINDVHKVHAHLQEQGINSLPYHAQMEPQDRTHSYQQWISGQTDVIVATIAFGMGINKKDVRFVFHFSMSKSLENYYQETGRAGRDGKPSDCILFYRFEDIFRVSKLNADSKSSKDTFMAMIKFCVNRLQCKKKTIAEYFGDDWNQSCNNHCDNCISPQDHIEMDVSVDIRMLARIIEHNSEANNKRLLFPKLLDVWLGQKVENQLRPDDLVVPNYSRDVAQQILVYLMMDNWLREDIHVTPYTTLCYSDLGRKFYTNKNFENVLYKLPIGQAQDSRNIIYKAAPSTSINYAKSASNGFSNGSSNGFVKSEKAVKVEKPASKPASKSKAPVVKKEMAKNGKGPSPPKRSKKEEVEEITLTVDSSIEMICLD